ncbi:hypothetical protein ACFLTO_02980 [Chloroflexota bacterium]
MKKPTRIVKVGRHVSRLLMAVVVGLASISSFPAMAQAEPDPVDLVLGGEGATPWDITNIQPGDNSTKVVELHNAGTETGFVTIWVSDVFSSEGMNPEAETGETAEPGEMTDHLLFDLNADNLTSGVSLPVIFNNLPQSVSAPGHIELIPLKAGDTINLQWKWELPAQTSNDVQGDGISFTINYLLREFEITDLSDVVDNVTGVFTANVTVESEGGNGEFTIEEDTVGQTEEGDPLSEIWIVEIEKEPSAPSEDTTTVGPHYDAGPHGTTFDTPITVTFTYDPADIPAWASEKDLAIHTWDRDIGKWVELEGCTVDTINKTISAPISHFSRYTI